MSQDKREFFDLLNALHSANFKITACISSGDHIAAANYAQAINALRAVLNSDDYRKERKAYSGWASDEFRF